MKTLLYWLWQSTWGILQTMLGFIIFLIHIKDKHYFYHSALITVWKGKSSVSIGPFVFITDEPYFYEKLKDEYTLDELKNRLRVHEYGHTIQSIILGPLYLIVMGIPSTLWGFLPSCHKKRVNGVSYFSFYTERFANYLGEKVTKEKAMENLLID